MPGVAESPKRATLLLITDSFPYDAALEVTFLEPELPFLQATFERVFVIPSRRGGARSELPNGVEVDEGLALHLEANSGRASLMRRGLVSGLFWRDVFRRPSIVTSVRAIKRLVGASARAELTCRWLSQMFGRRSLKPAECVAYTFWCDESATSLGLLKQVMPDLVAVSRAHGADLYLERYDPPYIPNRAFTLEHLDQLLPDSDRGAQYVMNRYPWFADRCEVSRMGVMDPGFVTRTSPEGRFSVASCSLVVPIKRVGLMMRGIACAARARPDVEFTWHHYGEGPLRHEIEEQARAEFPANAVPFFPGYPGHSALMRFYRDQPVDVFLNASVSEGTPVSIMEAIACGIPVIATAVGGNPEIVSPDNGALLGPDPSPEEIAEALLAMVDDRNSASAMRMGSRRKWEAMYDGSLNYSAFGERIAHLAPVVVRSL